MEKKKRNVINNVNVIHIDISVLLIHFKVDGRGASPRSRGPLWDR